MEGVFFVCGTERSGVGIRGTKFNDHFKKRINSHIFYREGGMFNFFTQFKKINSINPQFFYILDVGQRGLLTYLLLRLFGKKPELIIDTGDIPYEILKLHKPFSILNIYMMYFVEKILFKLSSKIIVRGSYHQKILKKYKKVYLIPDGVFTKDFAHPNKKEIFTLRKKFNPKSYVTVGLLGSINFLKRLKTCSGEETLEILEILKDYPLKGIIIGDGDGFNYLKSLIEKKNLQGKVELLGRVEYSKVPEYLNLIDICLIPLSDHISMRVRTTGKFPLYLASNRYIISTQVGDAKKYIKENGKIIYYSGLKDNTWTKRVSQEIEKILKKPSLLKKSSVGFKIAKENLDYNLLFEKLEKILLKEKN